MRLVIAAIPQDEAYFAREVAPHIDGDRVRFVGAVEREARDALLGGALALVHMTTRPERFGLTMIEAMACGTPVLGARMGSIPEIVVDGETGYLVAFDAADGAGFPLHPDEFARDLAARVNQLLGDPDQARSFGRAGRRRVLERFGWPAVAAETAALYRRLRDHRV
ncbi:MAG: hypothetical protein NVSMB21_04450 [Vulcanimicrobiaceae bacterium]